MRPVINFKALNKFILFMHFKMEGMHTLRDVLKENDWMAKVDLKDAYFMIPIWETDRDAPLLRSGPPVPVHLSTIWPIMGSMGLTILVMADSKPQAVEHSQALIFLLESLSFIVHPEKTVRVHTWKIKFLGMNILSKIMRLQFPPQKIKKVWAEVAARLRRVAAPPTAREVSRLRGKMNSVEQALPPGPLYCRIIQRDLAQAVERVRQSYETPCWLSDLAKEELS